ncbi:MAG: glycosyltransferase family 4 protein [Deltaproteobacteria bacterium]|nr:glycosyltransferase family 4 protein [Deltaproteobacteria bacterium]
MKIAFKQQIKPLWILFSTRWGGAEQVALSDMVDLAREGVAVSLLCVEGSPLHAAALRHPRIHVQTFPARLRRLDVALIGELRETVSRLDANIVLINDESLLWYLVPALIRHPEVSLVASRHNPVESPFKKWMRAPLYGRVDYLTVLSESVRSSVLSNVPIPERKIKVINLGLDFTRFDSSYSNGQAMRASWGAGTETVVIGSVGRLSPDIGQDTFLKAAAGLMKYRERNFRFVIVGEDPLVASDEYIAELKELVRQFHMDDFVTFASLGDNLPEVMAAFDIFVMPGREEVPGLGALEALAMERPVVLSRVVGSEDIVGNQEFGLLVHPEDAFDLQQKIRTLLEHPAMRQEMGINGRKYVLKHFDKRTRFLRTVEVFERCMKRRFARSGELKE